METTFENPEHELFMLAVLLGRFEMAKIFCFNGKVTHIRKLSKSKIRLKKGNRLIENYLNGILRSQIIFFSGLGLRRCTLNNGQK